MKQRGNKTLISKIMEMKSNEIDKIEALIAKFDIDEILEKDFPETMTEIPHELEKNISETKFDVLDPLLQVKQQFYIENRLNYSGKDEQESRKEKSKRMAQEQVKMLKAALSDPEEFCKFFYEDHQLIKQELTLNYYKNRVSSMKLQEYIDKELQTIIKNGEEGEENWKAEELTTRLVIVNPDFYKASWFTSELFFFKEFCDKYGSHPHLGLQIGNYIIEWNSFGLMIPRYFNPRQILGLFYFKQDKETRNIKKQDLKKVFPLFFPLYFPLPYFSCHLTL